MVDSLVMMVQLSQVDGLLLAAFRLAGDDKRGEEPHTLTRGPSGTGSKGIKIIPARPQMGKGARVP